jgi:DNA-binding transcriptional LysR family regulator
MELRHLRYFVAVAREGHFGRAAMKLNVAQPAISRAIQTLEHELGVELFERLPRGVRLAEAGHHYLKEVERILADLAQASKGARAAAAMDQREVMIGQAALNYCHDEIFDHALERFCRARPGSDVHLQMLNSVDQQQAIRDRTIDVGFGYFCEPPIDGVFIRRVDEDPLCGVRIGAGNPLSRLPTPQLAELSAEPLLMFRRSRNPQVFDYVVKRLQAAGFRGEVLQNAEFSFWHWKFMSKDSGWMLCTRRQLEVPMTGTVCLPISLSISYGLDFLWSDGTDPAVVKAFSEAFVAPEPRHDDATPPSVLTTA